MLNFVIPESLLSVSIACLLIVFVFIQLVIDIKEARWLSVVSRKLKLAVEGSIDKPFCVVIEKVTDSIEAIRLIDHLLDFKYQKLEIITIVGIDADKGTMSKLRQYGRKNKYNNLRILSDKKNFNLQKILHRYLSSGLLLVMSVDQRLSKDFFVRASMECAASSCLIAALPSQHADLDNTITSGLSAHVNILHQITASLFGVKILSAPVVNGVVYNIEKILEDNKPQYLKLRFSQRLYVSGANTDNIVGLLNKTADIFTKGCRNLVRIGLPLLMFSLLILVMIMLSGDERIIFVVFVLAVYSISALMSQLRTKGYSFIESICIFLIAPFGLIFVFLSYLLGLFRLLFKSKK